MNEALLTSILVRHLTRLIDDGDIAGCDALNALLEDMPPAVRDAVDQATA